MGLELGMKLVFAGLLLLPMSVVACGSFAKTLEKMDFSYGS